MDIVLFHLHNSLSLIHTNASRKPNIYIYIYIYIYIHIFHNINAVPTVLALLLSGNCPLSLFYANLSAEFHELSVNV